MNEVFRDVAHVDAEIARLQAALEQAGSRCSDLVQAQADLAGQLRQAFAQIARVQVDSLAGQPDAAHDPLAADTLPALHQRASRIQAQRERLAALRAALESTGVASAALQVQRDDAAQRLQLLCDGVDAALEQQPSYQPLLTAFHAADDAAHAARRMATSAHEERDAKAGAYEADRIFMYLLERRFGSADYRAGPLARIVDGWLAQLCGFEAASRDYALLTALPAHLDAHAEGQLALAEAAADRVEQVRRPALVGAGVEPVEAQLQGHQAALGAALLESQLKRAEIDTVQASIDACVAWVDPTGMAILEKLAGVLAGASPEQVDQRVLATPSPEDDRLLGDVRQLRLRIDGVAEALRTQQQQMQQDRARVELLGQARREHLAREHAQAREYRVQASHARRSAYAAAPVSAWSSLLGGGGGSSGGHRSSGPSAARARPSGGGSGSAGGSWQTGGGTSSSGGSSNGFRTGGGF